MGSPRYGARNACYAERVGAELGNQRSTARGRRLTKGEKLIRQLASVENLDIYNQRSGRKARPCVKFTFKMPETGQQRLPTLNRGRLLPVRAPK